MTKEMELLGKLELSEENRAKLLALLEESKKSGKVSSKKLVETLDAVDATGELAPRQSTGDTGDQRVGDLDDAVIGGEPGDQDVRAVDVPAGAAERGDRAHGEAAAPLRVEDSGEDGRGVQRGDGEPVDLPVLRDERDGAAVADRGVGPQRDVAALPLPVAAVVVPVLRSTHLHIVPRFRAVP